MTLKQEDAEWFHLYSAENSLRERVWKMHNMKHDQQACRRRKALKIEHAHSPFRVFHNYSSSLRGPLRVLPNLTTKEKRTMWAARAYATIIKPATWIYFLILQMFCSCAQDQKLCNPVVKSNWISRKKNKIWWASDSLWAWRKMLFQCKYRKVTDRVNADWYSWKVLQNDNIKAFLRWNSFEMSLQALLGEKYCAALFLYQQNKPFKAQRDIQFQPGLGHE